MARSFPRCVVIALLLAGGPANADGTAQRAAARPRGGTIMGTVLWTGGGGSCDVHEIDMAPYPDVTGGLADVVVVAEPMAAETRRLFRERVHPTDEDDHGELYWSEQGSDWVVTVAPGAPLEIYNGDKHAAELRFFDGKTLVKELSVPAGVEATTVLPEGLLRVVDARREDASWVYVTPFPAKVSGGNCRFDFSDLPGGRYRLRGWHPTAGRRSRVVNVRVGAKLIILRPLIYGNAQGAGTAQGARP